MAKIGAALVAALVIIAFGKILLSMVGRFFRFWLKLPVLAKVILPAVLIVFCLHGSMKNRGAFSIRSPNAATVSDIDIERGFKLESVVTNAAYSYELASNALRNAAWHLAGGHSAFNRYNLGWSFPMGENTYDHIIAFQEGSVFHNPRDEYPLFRLYDGVLSFIPGYSDFWSLIDDKRGVFTWHNVVPYDKTNEVVSVQLEIIKNGDFTIRSNELENVYRRINPDDWDNDGLANEVDNAPKSYDGDFFGVASPLPEGALESAYCWVNLCVTGVTDTATVRVTCDGPSDLGDHIIIARTNEVFRVPLLKGAYYDIESTLPMIVVDQSSDNIDIWCNDCWYYHTPSVSHHYLSVSYYVDFRLENNGNLCELKSSENIGAAVSDVTGACCKSDITSLGFRWCCNASCNCGGDHEHYLDGLVSWEGYTTWLGSWVYCACAADDSSEEESKPPVSLSLSIPRVIFTNNNGAAELSDLAPLTIGFVSPVATNGVVVVDSPEDTNDIAIWVDTNKTQRVDFPIVLPIEGSSFSTNLYVEGLYSSYSEDAIVLCANWKEEESGTAKISVTRRSTIYYPVANVINCTLYDNGRLCNPSGIIVGSNACFVVEFPYFEPPSSEIKWSVVEGSARFVGGDTGSKVYVTSDIPNQIVKLRVQVGDCVSRPIEFTAFTVEPLSVKTTVWIVRDDRGNNAARTADEVRTMMSEVNRIYDQIGVSFYIDSISYTNRDDWLDISVRRDGKDVCDFVKRRQLVNLSQNTNGFELYFINRISENATANKTNFGIVISTNATAFTIAHEIGHSFGCSDIYCVKKSDGRTPLSSNNVDITRAELDWSNGAGCRYYSSDITQSKIIKRLIMCGHGYRERGDLSSGSVFGYTKYDEEGLVDIGFFRGSSRRSPIYHR